LAEDAKSVISEFKQVVNMTAEQLESWLETDDSKEVGQKDNGGESKGHQSGRYIVELLGKKQMDYTDDDLSQMKRVISYVHRHSAQRPSGDVEHTRWRYSLMNWGHDPLK
jgi:hypothetical protein